MPLPVLRQPACSFKTCSSLGKKHIFQTIFIFFFNDFEEHHSRYYNFWWWWRKRWRGKHFRVENSSRSQLGADHFALRPFNCILLPQAEQTSRLRPFREVRVSNTLSTFPPIFQPTGRSIYPSMDISAHFSLDACTAIKGPDNWPFSIGTFSLNLIIWECPLWCLRKYFLSDILL